MAFVPSILALGLAVSSPAMPQVDRLDEAIDLHAAGRFDEALESYEAFLRSATDGELRGIAENNVCAIWMLRGDYATAETACREALRLRREIQGPGLAQTLNNLALTLQYLGRFDEAEAYFSEALTRNLTTGDVESQVVNYANLGLVAASRGQYERALSYLARGIELVDQHPDEPWGAEQGVALSVNRAVVLEKVGAYREALDLQRALLAREDDLTPWHRASVHVNVGVLYRNLGDPARALEALERAITVYQALGLKASLSNALLNKALVLHLNLRKPHEAEPEYRRALELARRSGDRNEEIQDLFYLGRLLLSQDRLEEADRAFVEGLQAAEATDSAEGMWSCLEGRGRVAEARGEWDEALAFLGRALDRIERVRAGLVHRQFRSGYFGDKRSVYAAAVRVLWSQARGEPHAELARQALGIAERAKMRDLLDALEGAREQPATRPGRDFLTHLGKDAWIAYFVGEDRLFTWIVSGNTVKMFDSGKAAPVLEEAARLHRILSSGDDPPETLLGSLARTLLRPLGHLPEAHGTLHISPDEGLAYVPFELLPLNDGSATILLDRGPVSYFPSFATRAWRQTQPPRRELGFIGIGASEVVLTPKATRTSVLLSHFSLEALPATEEEIRAAAARFGAPAEIYVGRDATEANFKKLTSRGARVVHVAAHTVLDERVQSGAAIVLGPSEHEDGLLFPDEISALDYRADLTVLAACRTALGSNTLSGALSSLTGAFLASGSSAVVATLWDVDDQATSAFMSQFYHFLGRGETAAEALQKAKLRMRDDPQWQAPALWSGYVLVGNTEGDRALPSLTMAALGVFSLTLAVVLIGRRRRNRTAGAH